VFSGGTRPGTWWQSACGQPSLGPPRAGAPSKFVCGFPRFRAFFVVLCRLFCRSCGRGRCVGCVFSLFSAFVVVVAWVPFLFCSVVVSRLRCSFVFVGVSLFRCFFAVWSCPRYRHTFMFPYMPRPIPHGEGHLLLWFQPIEAPVTMFGTGFVSCILFISAVCLCLIGFRFLFVRSLFPVFVARLCLSAPRHGHTFGRPPPALVSAHRGTRYHVRYGFCYMYFIHQRSLFVLTWRFSKLLKVFVKCSASFFF